MRQSALMFTGVALALAACGSETSGEFTTEDGKNAEYTIDKETGETTMTVEGPEGEATLRSGAAVPVKLPDGFSLFPGSRVVTNTLVNQPDGQGMMVMFEAGAPTEAVIAHYRDQAEAAGFDIQLEMNTNGTQMIGGERKRDGSTLSVTASPGDGQTTTGQTTTGQIIIGTKTPG